METLIEKVGIALSTVVLAFAKYNLTDSTQVLQQILSQPSFLQQVTYQCEDRVCLQVLLVYVAKVHPHLQEGLIRAGAVGTAEYETSGVLDDLKECLEEDENSLFFDVKVDELSRFRLQSNLRQALIQEWLPMQEMILK